MIRLTDEEMLAIQNEYTKESRTIWGGAFARDEKTELAFALTSIPDRVAKAQIEKVVEWGDEDCEEHGFRLEGKDDDNLGIVYPKRRECSKCWQGVKE